jgi:hypothetical protein
VTAELNEIAQYAESAGRVRLPVVSFSRLRSDFTGLHLIVLYHTVQHYQQCIVIDLSLRPCANAMSCVQKSAHQRETYAGRVRPS